MSAVPTIKPIPRATRTVVPRGNITSSIKGMKLTATGSRLVTAKVAAATRKTTTMVVKSAFTMNRRRSSTPSVIFGLEATT